MPKRFKWRKAQAAKEKPLTNPDQNTGDQHKREITGDVHVRGEVETKFPPNFVKDYETAQQKETAHKRKTFAVEVITMVAVIIYAGLASWQACLIRESNGISRESLQSVQRAFVYLDGYRMIDNPTQPGVVTFALQLRNSAITPAKNARYHANRGPYPLPDNFTFPDYDTNGKVVVDSEKYQGDGRQLEFPADDN
jgi:hypothetical protein